MNVEELLEMMEETLEAGTIVPVSYTHLDVYKRQAQNPLKTVYLEMFYTGYNESASANIPLACYLLADHMDWRSPNRYAYLSEMGGLAAYADLLLPARHGIASPSSMPALWKAKLTDGYTPDSYGYVTYPDSGEAYRGRGFVYTLSLIHI